MQPQQNPVPQMDPNFVQQTNPVLQTPYVTNQPPVPPFVPPVMPNPIPNQIIQPPIKPKKNFTILLLILLLFALSAFLVVGYVVFIKPTDAEKHPNILTFGGGANLTIPPVSDLGKYQVDTDKDGYPDFIEKEIGLDPNESERDRCLVDDCQSADLNEASSTTREILIILDDSGSMDLKIGAETRMALAKEGLKKFLQDVDSNTKVGLMLYGHKGSNSEAQKSVSCASAEVITQIGGFNKDNAELILSPIKPVGWTPMGLALSNSKAAFASSTADIKEVILVSDGEESCNTDPIKVAGELKTLGIKVNVIGFAVKDTAATQLSDIAKAGGGGFAVANSVSDFDNAYQTQYENGLKVLDQNKCTLDAVDEFRSCYMDAYNQVYQYISARKLTKYDDKISDKEFEILDELADTIFDQQTKVNKEETDKAIQKSKEAGQQVGWGE